MGIVRRDRINELQIFSWDIDEELDLSVLTLAPELEALYLHVEKSVDWTPLQSLTQLQKLTLIVRGQQPQSLDFTQFRNLHTSRLTWCEEWHSILSCKTLRGLTVENSKNIKELDLHKLSKLSELCLTECNGLRTIRCDKHQLIESLGVASCRSFESLEPFEVLKDLKYVVFGGNFRFDIRRLGECHKLKRFSMNGVGKISSLQFLANSPNLERIAMHFSTQIEDGDLSVLMNSPKLRHVSFKRYKNYSHTLDEVKRRHNIS